MQYYALLTAAVTMFSFQFLFNKIFQNEYGSGLRSMLVFTAGSSFAGLIVLLAVNGFKMVEYTHFTLLMAFLAALDSIGYSYFSLKALGKINLSLYSMFAMLGGMLLPFFAGIFFGEAPGAGKILCCILLILALIMTVQKSRAKSGFIYYIGVFMLNGLSGVLSTVFEKAEYDKASPADYSIMIAALVLVISLVFLPFTKKGRRKITLKAVISMGGYGILCRMGNYLLLISLAHLPASAQYPFVTGGVMIISTIICFFTKNKPSKREIFGVALSFTALLILMFM